VYGKKRKRRRCEEEFLVLMCGEVFMENVCKNQTWKEVVCNKYCSKASGFLVQLVVPPKSIVGFVSK